MFQSTQKVHSRTKSGYFTIEVLLSIAVLAVVVVGVFVALISIQRQNVDTGQKAQAQTFAEEALEAVRSMRNTDFATLSDGTYGLAFQEGQGWKLQGTSDSPRELFTRNVQITSINSNEKKLQATVSWVGGKEPLVVESRLTNWQKMLEQAYYMSPLTTSAKADGVGNKEIRGVQITNNGSTPVVIDQVRITWDKPASVLQEIDVASHKVWPRSVGTGVHDAEDDDEHHRHDNDHEGGEGHGKKVGETDSGNLLDIDDVKIMGNSTVDVSKIIFGGNVNNVNFTIELHMLDGSQKSFSFHAQQ